MEDMLGHWCGGGMPTGHPMDGLLEAYGWFGKSFVDADTVHPLLFGSSIEHAVALDPRWIPIEQTWRLRFAHNDLARWSFRALRPLLRTSRPRARLRMLEHRGVVSATMVYDHLPINDVFRWIDSETRLGLMDMRGFSQPFFFVLRRVAPG